MITFGTLRDVQREERKGGLSRLPQGFYLEVGGYIEELEKLCKDEDAKSLQAIELKNAKNVLQDIYDRREKKIVNMALMSVRGEKIDAENLTDMEGGLLDTLVASLKKQRKDAFNEVEKVKKGEKERLTVRFLEDFPAFSGVDTNEYGPFTKGSTAELPKTNAQILLKKGIVEK